MNELFRSFAVKTSKIVGSASSFIVALVVLVLWASTGPIFRYSDTWQLIINTGTTIVTFLIVFLIQNTQNRDSKSLHLKIDELLKATQGARNSMIDLAKLSDAQLTVLEHQYEQCASAVSIDPVSR